MPYKGQTSVSPNAVPSSSAQRLMSASPGRKYVAFLFPVSLAYDVRHGFRRIVRHCILTSPEHFHRKHPSFSLDDRRPKFLANSLRIDGSRHYDNLEVRSDNPLCLTRQCQCKITIQTAFVKFVEYDGGDTV
jgi:hypothetical protein